jgi:TetR/AcrR family transcriptional regulator, transcriptional repressor for nem operon
MANKQHPIDSRQHILDVGQTLIANKGFTAVGLAEILAAADVPKGSFYHYFASKEAFGVALLEDYFATYDRDMAALLAQPDNGPLAGILAYWEEWANTQGGDVACARKCLAVKLGSEVSDLSEAMRAVLDLGTRRIIERLAAALDAAIAAGEIDHAPAQAMALAETLYSLWLGASLMAKITRGSAPLQKAFTATRKFLHIR